MDLFAFISGLGPLIKEHSILFTFITSLFLGQEIVLVLSFLSANGYLPLWVVFVFSSLGRFVSDLFFFVLGRTNILSFLEKYGSTSFYNSVKILFSKLNRESLFVTLLYTKFLFGIRTGIMLYVGHKKISFKKIFISNMFATIIWSLILIPIGWFAGNSFKIILSTFDNVNLAVLFLFCFILIFLLANHYIKNRIDRKRIQLLL